MIFKEQLTNISTVLKSKGYTPKLLTSFIALDTAQQKVLLSSSLLSAQQKEQCATMIALTSANTAYTAEQLANIAGVSAETLANWGLIASTDTLTFSELAEKAVSDAQAKTVLEKIILQNAQAVANGEVTASNIALSASEGTAALATGTLTTAIKANIKAMWTWMTTTPLGWLTMLVGGIFAATKAYDSLTTSVEEQKEKVEESASAYEEAKNELSNITTELETQQQELDELITKDRDLTNEEQGRLKELQKVTQELRIQKDLAERKEKSSKKEAAKDASDLYKKQFGKFEVSEDAIRKYQSNVEFYEANKLAGHGNDLSALIVSYKEFKKMLNGDYGDKSKEELVTISNEMDNLKTNIFNTVEELNTQKETIADYYDDIKNIPYKELEEDQKEIVDSYIAIGNSIEFAYKNIDPNAWKKMQIDDVFNTEDIEKTKEELVEMSKAGTLDESTILSYSKLSDALKDNKLSANDLLQELNALAQAELEGQGSETSVEPYAISLDEAKKAVNGFKEGDTEIIGLIEEYELLQEVLSDTGNIQEETYEKLLSCSSKYSTAIRTENGRITVNTSKLKQVAKSRQLDTKEAIRQTLALKKQEWVQWNQGIENYNGTLLENIENTYGDIDALQSQITQYELLANSVDNASSAFENFKNAQSTEDQDMYNTAQDAFNVLKGYSSDPENENFGKYNRDEFQEAAMLLMDNDTYKKALHAKDLDEYQKIVDSFVKSVEPLFDEKNYNSASNLFDRINEIMESGDIPEADIDWAKRLGISKEMFHALSQFGDQYDFNHKEIFESYQLNTLDEYQALLSNVKTAQEALNECTDKTSNEYSYLSMELDEAKRKYSEFKNETADTLEKAYTDYIHSGAKSKGNFTEYLKKNLDFDDSDVTGSIDVVLDRVSELETEMSKLPQASEPYKKLKQELDEMNSLAEHLGYSAEQRTDVSGVEKDSLKNDISDYKELVLQAAEFKKTLEDTKEGTKCYNEAKKGLEEIKSQLDSMREPLKIRIESNMAEIDSDLSRLDEKIKGLQESLKHASGSNEAYAIYMDIKGAENEKKNLESQKSNLEKTLKIIADSDEAFSDVEKLQQETIEDKTFDIIANDKATPVLKEINELQLERKELNVDVKVNNPTGIDLGGSVNHPQPQNANPFSKYGVKADGTFNAFAQGTGSNVSIPKDEKALVNELGEEGVVYFYATLYSDVYEKFYLIAGNPLEPYKLQRNDEISISAKV